ncbi:MAG TPA: nuclear transport factor 2 family protein [Dictyobacter sp.]|jgi:hypothetical protein|nr:nuclear transport factor 2 family protein [Dictyobacter sp.]
MNTENTSATIVRNCISAIDDNNLNAVESYLSDTFTFQGWTPRPLDRAGFLDLLRGIKEGIPRLNFHLHNIQEQGDEITGSIQVTGYQSDSFIIPSLGIPPIPQMATSVLLPTEDVTFQVQYGKLTSMNVQSVRGGDLQGLLHQLGVDVIIVQ